VVVRAGGAGWQTVTTRDTTLARGQTSCVIDVVLLRGGTIDGRVVGASDGHAIAGALVRVATASESSRPAGTAIPAVAAVSDATGAFRVEGAPPGATIVSVEAEGFVTSSSKIDVPSSAPFVVRLSPGLEVSGRIELADGTPVESVNVSLSRSGERPGSANWYGATAETGADGVFSVRGLAPGTYDLRARGGYAGGNILPKTVSSVSAGTHDLRVVVQAGGVIAGRVSGADGRPIRGGRIVVQATDGTSSGAAETGADGSFRVLGLDGGSYSVWVRPTQPWINGGVAWGVTYLGTVGGGVAVGT
jgi:hypothetical protein